MRLFTMINIMTVFTLVVGGLCILSALLGTTVFLISRLVDRLQERNNNEAKQWGLRHMSELSDWCSHYWPIIGDVTKRYTDSLGETGYQGISEFRRDLARKYPNDLTLKDPHL